jgi:hypothetical protein
MLKRGIVARISGLVLYKVSGQTTTYHHESWKSLFAGLSDTAPCSMVLMADLFLMNMFS